MKTRKLNKQDREPLLQLRKLYNEVFETESDNTSFVYIDNLLKDERILFLVAEQDNQIIGGLTAHILPSLYTEKPEVFIYDIAVKQNLQRKGIGKKLIDYLLDFCSQQGYKEIFVPALTEDTHACNFYKKSGGEEEDIKHYSFKIK